MQLLVGKKAIITGGARGIGFSIAQELINQGAKVVICSRTNKDLETATLQLNNKNVSSWCIKVDVSEYYQCKKLITFAEKMLGSIDILINNAGIYGPIGLLKNNNADQWFKTIQVNLMSTVYCTQLVIPIMKKHHRGKIINLCGSGIGGVHALPRFSAYYTSKMGIAGFTEVMAEELRNDNIQVNCISPGGIYTAMTEYLIHQGPYKAGKEMYENAIKQKRYGGTSIDKVTKFISLLASDDFNHISGKLLSVRWDSTEKLAKNKILPSNLYKLRRIDNELFYERPSA